MTLPEQSSISPRTREAIRKGHADMLTYSKRADEARERGATLGNVQAAGSIAAANLEGWLGRFALPLLNALEEAERQRDEAVARLDAKDGAS